MIKVVKKLINANHVTSVTWFNMRKWASNSKALLEKIQNAENKFNLESFENSTENQQSIHEDELIKVLGLSWNQNTDKLIFDLSTFTSAAAQQPPTKRLILSTIARFFDPIGLLSPIVLQLKILFQDTCKQKINWDSPLSEEYSRRWADIVNDISQSPPIEIKRAIFEDINVTEIVSIQLHGFGDASKNAYGGTVYIRIKTNKGVTTKIVTSKTRICPLKGETIPRLELLAALTLARLIVSVQNALKDCCKIESIFVGRILWLPCGGFIMIIKKRINATSRFLHIQVLEQSIWNWYPIYTQHRLSAR